MRFPLTIALMLWCLSALWAQKSVPIGDPVPNLSFETVLYHSSSTARLSDFKGKLIILDFWATWCASCLHAFPKMDSLQNIFKDQLKIILVNCKSTNDDLERVQAFFTRWQSRTGKPLSLTTIVSDTITEKLFPHQVIPHYVWIDKNGKVLAITSSEEVTADNIRSVIAGGHPAITMKKDQDQGRPLFSSEDLPLSGLKGYSVLVKGWFEGLPSGSKIREREGVVCGRAMTNTSLLDMYRTIAGEIDPSAGSKRFMVFTDDSSGLFAPDGGTEPRDSWYKDHAFSLDVIVPIENASHLYERMLSVLNESSGYSGKFEKRKMKCWRLIADSTGQLKTAGGKPMNRLWDKEKPSLTSSNLSVLANYLNNLPAVKELVVNGTGFTANVDLQFDGPFSDWSSIRKNLSRYGLRLQREERVIKVFVIRKDKKDL